MHQRTVIRQAIVDRLQAANTAAGARVYPTRVLPLRKLELPAIAVYTLEEAVDRESVKTAPRELEREAPMVIEAMIAAESSSVPVDEAMDAIALEIETVMHADPYFGGAAGDSFLDSTSLEVIQEGDRLMGLVTMTYAVRYYTLAPEAPANVADFLRVKATENLGGTVEEEAQAVDEFTVQEAS